MKIAALYARVSTGNQEKEETILSQIAEIKERVAKDGYVLGDNLTFADDGWSGSILARPELDRLRDAVKSDLFQALYVYDLGRLSRDFLNQLILKKEIEEVGIKIVSLHDINNETPESGFAQNVMGLFHDYERIKIAERFRRGKLYKAQNKVLFGWNAPYGYNYNKGDNKNVSGSFQVIKEEAEIVVMIFKWFVEEQLTIRQVIVRLFDQRILPRKNKEGHWSTSTLSRLLRDETYIGTTYYNKRISVEPVNPVKNEGYKKIKKSSRRNRPKADWYPLNVPSLIDTETFNKAQRQLKNNSQFSMRNKVNEYLLSTLVRCECGNTRCGEGSGGHLYYRCTDRVNRFPLPRQCLTPGVNASILDAKVWNELYSLLTNPKQIAMQYDRWNARINSMHGNLNNIDLDSLKKELVDQNEQEERFVKAYGEQVISLEQLQVQLATIKAKKGQITTKLTQSRNDTAQANPLSCVLPELKLFSDTIKTEIDNLNFREKQYVVRQLVDRVVTNGVTASVEGYLLLDIPEEKEQNNYGQKSFSRYRWSPKRRQINTV